MHGYSATKYEASAVESPEILRRQFVRSYDQKNFVTATVNDKVIVRPRYKILRRQFGRSYYQKKVRNIYGQVHIGRKKCPVSRCDTVSFQPLALSRYRTDEWRS